MSLVFRGGTGGSGQPTVALHASTQVDDYVVIACIGRTVTDARFTKVYDPEPLVGVWTGNATTLDAVTLGGDPAELHQGVVCAVFAPAPLGERSTLDGDGPVVTVPSVPGAAAICAQLGAAVLLSPGVALPTGYTIGVTDGIGGSQARIDYWNSTGGDESPASTIETGNPNTVDWWLCVQSAYPATFIPPLRLLGRGDSYGAGVGRLYPPGITRQSGRLNGPY